jgi:hypothetical protein
MPRTTRRSLIAALLATLTLSLTAPASAELADLEKIRARGTLSVAVYDDFPPYSGKQGGIDHDVAEAIAKKLGLKLSLLPFPAGEDIGDDLRNMVWKGHYLGFGPADVMLHVPVDRSVMQKNDKVEIFAPYYRDTVQLVRNRKAIPDLNGIESLEGKKLGAEKVSISAMVLLGEASLRDNVTIFASGIEALKDLISVTGLSAHVCNPITQNQHHRGHSTAGTRLYSSPTQNHRPLTQPLFCRAAERSPAASRSPTLRNARAQAVRSITRYNTTGSRFPFSVRAGSSSVRNLPGVAATTSGETMISPVEATEHRREPVFTTSPTMV